MNKGHIERGKEGSKKEGKEETRRDVNTEGKM